MIGHPRTRAYDTESPEVRYVIAFIALHSPGVVVLAGAAVPARQPSFDRAIANGSRVEELLGRARRVLHAWLRHADPETLLLPDYLPSFGSGGSARPLVYTPRAVESVRA